MSGVSAELSLSVIVHFLRYYLTTVKVHMWLGKLSQVWSIMRRLLIRKLPVLYNMVRRIRRIQFRRRCGCKFRLPVKKIIEFLIHVLNYAKFSRIEAKTMHTFLRTLILNFNMLRHNIMYEQMKVCTSFVAQNYCFQFLFEYIWQLFRRQQLMLLWLLTILNELWKLDADVTIIIREGNGGRWKSYL